MIKTVIFCCALLLSATVSQAHATAHATSYSMQILPSLGGTSGDSVLGLNDRGEVVGYSSGVDSVNHAVMWRGGTLNDLSALGLTGVTSINNQGVITGLAGSSPMTVANGVASSLTMATIGHQGIYYSPFLQHSGLGNEQTLFTPIGIDTLGRVAGNIITFGCNSYPSYCNVVSHSAYLENSDATVICCNQGGTVRRSSAIDMNDGGQVLVSKTYVGSYGYDTVTFGSFSISDAAYQPLQGVLWSDARAINNAGDVVGSRYTIGYGLAFYTGIIFSGGVATDIGANFTPYGLNDSRQVVGTIGNRASIWSDGQATDLNSLVDLPEGVLMTDALAINNQGMIAGYANVNGTQRAFLFTPAPVPLPVPAPGTLALLGSGFLGWVGVKRRRRAGESIGA